MPRRGINVTGEGLNDRMGVVRSDPNFQAYSLSNGVRPVVDWDQYSRWPAYSSITSIVTAVGDVAQIEFQAGSRMVTDLRIASARAAFDFQVAVRLSNDPIAGSTPIQFGATAQLNSNIAPTMLFNAATVLFAAKVLNISNSWLVSDAATETAYNMWPMLSFDPISLKPGLRILVEGSTVSQDGRIMVSWRERPDIALPTL